MIKNLGQDTQALSSQLLGRTKPSAWTPEVAAQESCRIVAEAGFYPDRLVDAPYITRYQPVMLGRLALGGSRLAMTLNEIFDR